MKNKKITITLIGINVIVYILSGILSKNLMNINPNVLVFLGGEYGIRISLYNEWWRLITTCFLHGGIMHLAVNMYSLYILGMQIEEIYGKTKYIIIYFVSGIGGSLLSYFLNPRVFSVGASGAIFGLLSAMLVFAYINRDRIRKSYIRNLLFILILNISIGLSIPNIDNAGHIGGIIAGGIISYILMLKTKK